MNPLRVISVIFAVLISLVVIMIGFSSLSLIVNKLTVPEVIIWGCMLMIMLLIWGVLLGEASPGNSKSSSVIVRQDQHQPRVIRRIVIRRVTLLKKEKR